MLIHNKDHIEFVTEFPCLLGHPVCNLEKSIKKEENTSRATFIFYFYPDFLKSSLLKMYLFFFLKKRLIK